jgi:ACS family pantothenate transporter-like MFS transporter
MVEVRSKEAGERNLELESNSTNEVVKQTVTRKWQSYIWDTFDKSPEERRFLFKLDAALLTFASLGSSLSSSSATA